MKGIEFEEYVRDIYSMLLNLKDEGVIISQNTIVRGKSGEDY
jgi:hypothetical protein